MVFISLLLVDRKPKDRVLQAEAQRLAEQQQIETQETEATLDSERDEPLL